MLDTSFWTPTVSQIPQWDGLIATWLAQVHARSGSDRTTSEYRRYVLRFLAVFPNLLEATSAQVHSYAYGPHTTSGTPRLPGSAAVIVRLAALRSLYDFARRMGLVDRNPVDDVVRPRIHHSNPKGLTSAEARCLLLSLPDSSVGRRDRALILTALLTGLRRTELLSLTAGSITLHNDGISYVEVRVKGGAVRLREFPQVALAAIDWYLERGGQSRGEMDSSDRLFPISAQTYYLSLKRYAAKAGIQHIDVHTLRHSAAKLRREAGSSIEEVQQLLGHRSIATTAHYLARIEGQRDPGWQAAAALLNA